MNFLNKLFGKAPVQIRTYDEFWKWFAAHEKQFHKTVRKGEQIETLFFDKLSPVLHQLNENFYCLTGMYDDDTAELVISAEGEIKAFVFAEDLVAAAPPMRGWRFTALKPAIGLDTGIRMSGYEFNAGNISFYNSGDDAFPDEIDITFVHQEYDEDNKDTIGSGIQIFLENALGELTASMQIDSMRFGAANGNTLIPVAKLSEYLTWREAEFVEKYKNTQWDGDGAFSLLEAQDEYNMPIFAALNTSLLQWQHKPSHPWLLVLEIEYAYDENGLPNNAALDLLNQLEDELLARLEPAGAPLYLGRKTNGGSRMIYFACREFREVSRQTTAFIRQHPEHTIHYRIFKDKYWMTMDMFDISP
ncbi:DUF695 domain-containing protein [Chitinophaga lutea]|nr:DUF695 domain-containing protein [Chitinophaga lutea]